MSATDRVRVRVRVVNGSDLPCLLQKRLEGGGPSEAEVLWDGSDGTFIHQDGPPIEVPTCMAQLTSAFDHSEVAPRGRDADYEIISSAPISSASTSVLMVARSSGRARPRVRGGARTSSVSTLGPSA